MRMVGQDPSASSGKWTIRRVWKRDCRPFESRPARPVRLRRAFHLPSAADGTATCTAPGLIVRRIGV